MQTKDRKGRHRIIAALMALTILWSTAPITAFADTSEFDGNMKPGGSYAVSVDFKKKSDGNPSSSSKYLQEKTAHIVVDEKGDAVFTLHFAKETPEFDLKHKGGTKQGKLLREFAIDKQDDRQVVTFKLKIDTDEIAVNGEYSVGKIYSTLAFDWKTLRPAGTEVDESKSPFSVGKTYAVKAALQGEMKAHLFERYTQITALADNKLQVRLLVDTAAKTMSVAGQELVLQDVGGRQSAETELQYRADGQYEVTLNDTKGTLQFDWSTGLEGTTAIPKSRLKPNESNEVNVGFHYSETGSAMDNRLTTKLLRGTTIVTDQAGKATVTVKFQMSEGSVFTKFFLQNGSSQIDVLETKREEDGFIYLTFDLPYFDKTYAVDVAVQGGGWNPSAQFLTFEWDSLRAKGATAPEENPLENGKSYIVSVDMRNYDTPSSPSMANSFLDKTGEILVDEKGTARLTYRLTEPLTGPQMYADKQLGQALSTQLSADKKTVTFTLPEYSKEGMVWGTTIVDIVASMGQVKYGFKIYWETLKPADASAANTVRMPIITPDHGTMARDVSTVTLISATDGASIYYTVDGTNPTEHSARYTEPFMLNGSHIVKAIAVKSGMKDSAIATAGYKAVYRTSAKIALNGVHNARDYTMQIQLTTLGGVIDSIDVQDDINIGEEGGQTSKHLLTGTIKSIGDRLRGKNPLDTAQIEGVDVLTGATISSNAIKRAVLESVRPTLTTPQVTPSAGFEQSISVTMRAEDGATIYYTTDGSIPSTRSTVYKEPLTLNNTTTIKAFAVKSGYRDSAVSTTQYDKLNGETVYTGVGNSVGSGRGYAIPVRVFVKNGKIERVEIDDQAPLDSKIYMAKAIAGMRSRFAGLARNDRAAIEKIDAVTGATDSSNGIKKGVLQALGQSDVPAGNKVPQQDGVYSANLTMRKDKSQEKSMSAGLFATQVDITISGDNAIIRFYVANPIPSFASADYTGGTMKDIIAEIDGIRYTARYEKSGVQKLFDKSSMGTVAGQKHTTDTITLTIPKAALRADHIDVSAFINVVMKSTVYFDMVLSGYTSAQPGGIQVLEGSARVDQFGKYMMYARVSVRDGVISGVDLRADGFGGTHAQTNQNMAESVINRMKNAWNGLTRASAQEVYEKGKTDAITGATYSSHAARDAVMNALGLTYVDEVIHVPTAVPAAGTYELPIDVYTDLVYHSLTHGAKANKAKLTVEKDGSMTISFPVINGTAKEPLYTLDFKGYYTQNDRSKPLLTAGIRTEKTNSSYQDTYFHAGTQVVQRVTMPLIGGLHKEYYARASIYVPAMNALNGNQGGTVFEHGKFEADTFVKLYWDEIRRVDGQPIKPPVVIIPNKPNVTRNGTYKVPVKLMNEQGTRESMGDAAFANNRFAYVTTANGNYTIEIATNPVVIGTMKAGVGSLQAVDNHIDELAILSSDKLTGGEDYVTKFRMTTRNIKPYYMIAFKVPGSPMTGFNNARLMLDWDNIETAGDTLRPNNRPGAGAVSGVPEVTKKQTAVSVKTQVKTDAKGNAVAAVADAAVTDAIDKLLKEAGKNDSKELQLVIDASKEAQRVETTLTKKTIETLHGKLDAVQMVTPLAELTLDKKTLETLVGQSADLKIVVEKADIAKHQVTDAQVRRQIGDAPVLELTIVNGDKKLSSFGGKITVRLPYTLPKERKAAQLTVYHLTDDGKAQTMENARYDEKTKTVVFDTPHFSLFAVAFRGESPQFTDVRAGDWFHESVRYVAENGLFSGTSDSTFEPNREMTRAMLVTVLYRMEGSPSVTEQSAFADVSKDAYYANAVTWANKTGLVTGTESTVFAPDVAITREQLATVLHRYATKRGYALNGKADITAFSDVAQITGYAQRSVEWAVSQGLLTGTTAQTLAPHGNATRAQVAAILMRYHKNVVNANIGKTTAK